MLMENAFLKIPELMVSNLNSSNVEALVVQYLANGLQMELNCRSVPFAYNYVIVEHPYPDQDQTGATLRADLLFKDLEGVMPNNYRLDQYGYKTMQWVEVKSFFSRSKSVPPTTQNIGRIIKDILRLCLLPHELQGRIRQNGRYVLLIFDKHPSKYLAYSNRDWLKVIFEDIAPSLTIDLSEEKQSLVKGIVNASSIDAQIEITLSKHYFEPIAEGPSAYWGYLLRIDEFSISINGKHVELKKDINMWDKEQVEALQSVRTEFIGLLKRDEGDGER